MSKAWRAQPYSAASLASAPTVACILSRSSALSQDLPVVVEIVDTREKPEKFLEEIDHEIEEGMATLEEVKIHFYRSSKIAESSQKRHRIVSHR